MIYYGDENKPNTFVGNKYKCSACTNMYKPKRPETTKDFYEKLRKI